MINECKNKILLKIIFGFAVLLIVFLLQLNSNKSLATTEDFMYLSDINWKSAKTAWGSVLKDKTSSNTKIAVKIEGGYYQFDKGIWAHATSTIEYDLRDYEYDYFIAYIGLNQTAASSSNGVKFYIYTSADGKNWNLKTPENPIIYKAGDNAGFVKIDIRTEKYLKLVANDNGANGNDHAVYADAKLIKEGYKEPGEDLVPSIAELDNKIKTEFENANIETNKDYELTLLKRELISKVGNYALKKYLNESDANKEAYTWLTSDVDTLRLFVLGGAPEKASYYDALNVLSKLYDEYKEDFSNETKIENEWVPNLTYGELYKKMAFSIALTYSQRTWLWMQPSVEVNQSDPCRRYAIYKYMHKNGMLNALGGNWDITKWFEALQVEEMRLVMNNFIDDEEIIWLNRYVQQNLDKFKQSKYLTPHPYMAYVWPNYQNAVYYSEENKEYFNDLFKVGDTGLWDLTYTIPGGKNIPTYTLKITRGTSSNKIQKVWMNFRNKFGTGAVCGGISKTGTNIRTTHGIPAVVIGQPAHAAILYYTKNQQGQGYWGIDNDVSGWTLSEKGERMILGWGNASYSKGYSVVYITLAQEAMNDYNNLVKAEENVMLAKVYAGDEEKQEKAYREALKIQPINIDAWYGLISLYNASTTKTENDYYNLAEELAESLKCFPLPMYHLTNLIKPKLTSIENSYKFTLLQTRILTEGSVLPNTATDQVLQPGITRTMAKYLLGKIDKTIASFSFDGSDAGKIVLASKFDGNGIRWDYSLDGKQTWNEVSFTAEEEHKLQLTPKQINSITAENDIYVHIVGVGYEETNLFKIDILKAATPANNIYNNDLENRVVGVDLTMEWRMAGEKQWTSYRTSSPDLTGDKTVEIRVGATGTYLPSEYVSFGFTQDNQPDTRKYIPVSHLSIAGVSTQATDNGGAAINAIDGNYNTRWHSAWNGTDTQRFIIIKLDKPVYLSAVEFVPAGGGNGRINDGTIYGSIDGENWEMLTSRTGITYPEQANTNEKAKTLTQSFDIPKDKIQKVEYVKIVADRTNGNWFTARAFNLFQDITMNPHPTAGIAYSTTEPTNGIVIARLINPSEEIKITKPEDGSDTHIFTENGEFTFEFEDVDGNQGSATAKVNWIDKSDPTADIEYKLDADKKLTILLEGISEDVYLLDKNNNKINYIEVDKDSQKVSKIKYLDSLGNIYKILDVDENGNTIKRTYKNITGKVPNVAEYTVTKDEDGNIVREYLDSEGNPVTISDSDKEILFTLEESKTSPLEYVFEVSGEYEFKLLDRANNIAYKSIKVDYIENDTTILASDITYNITKTTNKDVVVTINPYVITEAGEKTAAEVTNNNSNKDYTFTENGEFTFEYKDVEDKENWEIKTHKAKVSWIDKVAPTAQVSYNIQQATTNPVIATLVNESEEIIVTNNGTSKQYTFNKNGEFIFEFEDKAGNKGSVKAKVDWIQEKADEYKEGDINQDNKITATDILLLKRHLIAGQKQEWILKEKAFKAGDLNKDDKITATDLILLQRLVLQEIKNK